MRQDWRVALERGDIASLDAQLAAGADIDARDEYGQTGLMNAARDGRAEVVRLLVERGAALGAPGFFDKTARDFAEGLGDERLIALLAGR